MHNNHAAGSPPMAASELHVVFSAGGSRAILGGAGSVLAFHVLDMRKFRTIGGASGGSLPAMLLASGQSSKDVLRLAIDTDFNAKLTPNTGWLGRLLSLLMKFRYEKTLPPEGAYGWRKLQELVDTTSPKWPDNFWTMAICKHGQVIFTADGVVKYERGVRQAISSAPLSVGLAVCATCAVPGIIDAVPYGGEHLFDGALSDDGQCPVEVVKRHFGAPLSSVIAFDVGEEDIKQSRWLRLLWNIFCGGSCGNIEGKHPEEKDGLVLIKPRVTGFHAFQFSLARDLKWRAVIAGFVATVRRLEASGIPAKAEMDSALALAAEFEEAERSAEGKARGVLSAAVEKLLSARGLF